MTLPSTTSEQPGDRAMRIASRLFERRGWTPFDFQRRTWSEYLNGRSGLIHAPTGVGKTLAAWMGPLAERAAEIEASRSDCDVSSHAESQPRSAPGRGRVERSHAEPLRVLWLTPLRALATDTVAALEAPIVELAVPWSVELRTSDTSSSLKLKQRDRLPSALVTTPESLSLLMSYPVSRERFSSLRCVIVDEWHELMGSKRGVQVELALARLRSWCPGLRTWGMSATLGNLDEAARTLLGRSPTRTTAGFAGSIVRSELAKRVEVETLLPDDPERFTWAGHLGIRLAPQVLDAVARADVRATLLFTNTRSQAEIWFKRFLDERPELLGHVAIHHGSLDHDLRRRVEGLLDEGRLRCVVCTSSLDLGIDFKPVDQVIQLGSPKGVARLLQRAGRSGHSPGAVSRVLGVPTNAFELVEFAALREQVELANQSRDPADGAVEARRPLDRPIDVLVQHIMTCAIGGGFIEHELREEVRSTIAFQRLSDGEWEWAMGFVRSGGEALKAYPQYAKINRQAGGRFIGASEQLARLHRLTIGTINSSPMMSVKYTTGQFIGTIEEQFISRQEIGVRFILAGRVLELVRLRDMTAWVRRAPTKSGIVPRWDGGRMSLSTLLAAGVRRKLDEARRGVYSGPEMERARPLLELQMLWSALPGPDELLIEHVNPPEHATLSGRRASGGYHAFVYLFDGRLVHEGLGALLAHRLTRRRPITVTATATDQGLSLASPDPLDLTEQVWRELLSPDQLLEDLMACLNSSVLARRQFRDIARVAGLVVNGYPRRSGGGEKGGGRGGRPMRHLQASSEMFFDVLEQFDRGNLLLDQARREVLGSQLEVERVRSALERASRSSLRIITLDRLTPLAFPIWAETLRSTQTSSEKWSDLVQKMVARLESISTQHDARSGYASTRAVPQPS